MAVNDAKEFAAAFACALTEATDNQSDLIIKNGQESLYGILERVFPQVWLSHNRKVSMS